MRDDLVRQEVLLGELIGAGECGFPDFGSFDRFARLASAVYRTACGSYLSPAERREYEDLHLEAEAVVGLFLGERQPGEVPGDECHRWAGKWRGEAQEVAGSIVPLARKMRMGVRAALEGRRWQMRRAALAEGLCAECRIEVEKALAEGDDPGAFEMLCSCLFADQVRLDRSRIGEMEDVGRWLGADPHLWRMLETTRN